MALDDDLDELFSAPVEEFVALRDALVRRLKAEGDKEQAAEVKGWRRPTRVVGALNRLALTDGETASELADAAEAVGSSRGPSLREANEQLRAALKRAAAAAVAGLEEARPSDLGEVTTALLSVAADPDVLASFREGRLLELPAAGQAGFGFGTEPPAGPSGGGRKRSAGRPRTKAPEREDELAARRQKAERARRADEVDAAAAVVRDAEAGAEDARTAADEAKARVADARQELAEAEAALAGAEAAVAAADARVAEAGTSLDAARVALDELDG